MTALDPVSANSLAFVVIGLGLVMLAWSDLRRWFPIGFAGGSILVLATWLDPLDLAALALFIVPPYLAIRRLWGTTQRRVSGTAVVMIGWEVLLFIYLRKYEWVGDVGWLDHPVAIIGLSYMLFRVIHLIVEAPSLGHLKFGPLEYVSFVFAFWTLLSGPIQRYEAFAQGMNSVGRPEADDALAASHRMVSGLIKAFVIAPIFLKSSDIGALTSAGANWLDFAIVLYSYPIYLYLNFSGYTDIVIAIARLCGVTTLPENFNKPYLARNLPDFWARWHMSFGDWIRHYVFTPLSKHLLGKTPPAAHNAMLAISLVVTFLVVGMWHGTTLNFLIFGLLHAGAIIIGALYGGVVKSLLSRSRRKSFEAHILVRAVSTVLCFHFVAATVLLFPNSVSSLSMSLTVFWESAGF